MAEKLDKVMDELKKELYDDLNPDFYKDLIQKFSGKIADLDYTTRAKLSSLITTLQKELKTKMLPEISKGAYDQLKRFRPPYQMYSQLYEKVPELYQAVNICLDNILSPDDATKESLVIKPANDQSLFDEILKKTHSFVKMIIDTTNLESRMQSICKNVLIKGDAYLEIVVLNDYVSQYKLLTDSANYIQESVLQNINENIDINQSIIEFSPIIENKKDIKGFDIRVITPFEINSNDTEAYQLKEEYFMSKYKTILHEHRSNKVKSDVKSLIESVLTEENDDIEPEISPADIMLIEHDCNNVVIVTDGYNTLGYIVVSGDNKSDMSVIGNENVLDSIVDKISTFLKNASSKMKKIFDEHPGLKNEIKQLIATRSIQNIKVRFIPYDRMQHFRIKSPETDPYGESLLYPVKDIAKYVIVAETAMLIYRLTRAVEKYIYKIDVGKEKTRVKEILNEFMRTQKQKLYAVTNAGDIDALMGTITMFEDIYTVTLDGKDLLSIDVIQGGDLNTRIDDLNYFKEKMMAATPVPNIYLKQENEESKYTLAQENIRFSRTIIRIQKDISEGLNELILKITALIEPSMLTQVDKLRVTLRPPVALQMEREAEMIGNVSNIVNALKEMGVPTEAIFREYLPKFDLIELEDLFQVSQKLEDITTTSGNNEEEGGL